MLTIGNDYWFTILNFWIWNSEKINNIWLQKRIFSKKVNLLVLLSHVYLCKRPRCEVTLNLYPFCPMVLPSLVRGKSLTFKLFLFWCYPWASATLLFANFEITLSNYWPLPFLFNGLTFLSVGQEFNICTFFFWSHPLAGVILPFKIKNFDWIAHFFWLTSHLAGQTHSG